MALFDKIKIIINNVDQSIKIINISKTFTIHTAERYLDNIKDKNNVILFIEKNKSNKFIFDTFKSADALIYYKDEYIHFSHDVDDESIKSSIEGMINGGNCICSSCDNEINVGITCENCVTSFCSDCILKSLKNKSNQFVDNDIMYLKCDKCNEFKIRLTQPSSVVKNY